MVVIKISDGLGNQMFQYAYAKALQVKTSQKVYIDASDINNEMNKDEPGRKEWIELCDKREYQLSYLSITLPELEKRKYHQIAKKRVYRTKFFKYCEALRLLPVMYIKESICKEEGFKFNKYQNYYVEGSFFNQKYYKDIEDILMQEFKIKEKPVLPKEIEEILVSKNTVSLHIRRGDFLKVGRNISEDNYYERAISYIKKKIEAPYVLLFSDDIEWVKSNIKLDIEKAYISDLGLKDWEEMAVMSRCKHNIIANSTFSYWGAWLNQNSEKLVIAPKGWRRRIIPDSWILL